MTTRSCCADSAAKQTDIIQGHEEKIAGLNTYKVGHGKSVIVVFSEFFGYSFTNTREVADILAQGTGTTVLVPDFFDGDAVDLSATDLQDKVSTWLKKHPVDQVCPVSDKFIAAIKDHYDSIQVISVCTSAKQVIHLVSQSELSSAVKSAIVVHPMLLVKEDAAQIKRPILFQYQDTNHEFTPDIREHFKRILAPTGLGTFIEYPGITGESAQLTIGSEEFKRERNRMVQDSIEFFKKNF